MWFTREKEITENELQIHVLAIFYKHKSLKTNEIQIFLYT